MSETARVLKFPDRRKPAPLCEEQAAAAAARFLERNDASRSFEGLNVDTLFALVPALRERAEISPVSVFDEAASLYGWVRAGESIGYFDEKEYLLGELALLVGRSGRQLGKLAEAELWLDRADSAFRHTVNSGPLLANVAFARLALRYESRRYDDVIELIPSLTKSFEIFSMDREVAKCEYLHAISLKAAGRVREYIARLNKLSSNPAAGEEPAVLGQTFVEIGSYHSSNGQFDEAMACYQKALSILASANRPIALAHLKWVIGETFRSQGQLSAALSSLRESQRDFSALGMSKYVVFLHLVVAEALIAMDRSREAEWEILTALPTIEEQKMVPEGFAAVTLLKESVRRRKTDPNALRELREQLTQNQ